MRTRSWTDDELIELVPNSDSLRQVVLSLNLKYCGGTNNLVRKYISELNLDTSHWSGSGQRKSIEEIFVENSSADRTIVKNKLIKYNLIPYECECGNTGEWRGNPISLQLHHKNGVNNDNRLENLEFLCPNCHTQTDTYAGKKNSKHNKVSMPIGM